MDIIANSIFVENQEEALQFYTNVLGFKKKRDEPVGEGFRWLTLVSPTHQDGTELILYHLDVLERQVLTSEIPLRQVHRVFS